MSSRNHKEVHGNKRHVANTAGIEQRSKFQNEFTKKKRIGDYPKQPNRRLGDVGGNTPSSMRTPSATSAKDPVIDTDSNDDVSTSVVDTRKMAPVDDDINNSRMQMDDMVPYHKFSNRTDQQVHDNLREKHFVLAKGYYQLVNELNHYKGRNSVQNSSIRGYQDSSISAALSERRSRLAKIEPSIVTKVVSFIFKTKKFCCEHRIKHPALSGPSSMKGISNHKQDWFAECCLTRLYTVKPELGKEVESDPELADFIWNGSDALLPMNQTIERTNKARLDYIKSTFGGMCIKKLRECQNVLNNQFKGILAGLTEYNFQTMDIDDFIRWALTLYRFAQSKDIDRGSHGYQVWRDVLAPVYFIGRTSRGEPFLTGDKSGVTKFQLSLRAQCELQTRFVGSLINASTEAFCFLVLKGKFRLQQKYLGFNPDTHEISENEIRHSTDFVDIGGKPLIKKSVREESSVSNGLTDQWTDDLLVYYKEIYTGLSQKNRSEYGRNPSGIATPTANIIYPHSYFSFPNVSEEDIHQYVESLQPNVPERNIDYNDRINQRDIDDDVDFEWI